MFLSQTLEPVSTAAALPKHLTVMPSIACMAAVQRKTGHMRISKRLRHTPSGAAGTKNGSTNNMAALK